MKTNTETHNLFKKHRNIRERILNIFFKTYIVLAMFLVLLAFICLCSGCGKLVPESTPPEVKPSLKNYGLNIYNGSSWSSGHSTVYCDSFQMVSPKECYLWSDGRKMLVKCSDVIYPFTNEK